MKILKRVMLLINLPLCMIIPAYNEFFLDGGHPKAAVIYAALYFMDTVFFFNLFMFYGMLQKTVFAIRYLP